MQQRVDRRAVIREQEHALGEIVEPARVGEPGIFGTNSKTVRRPLGSLLVVMIPDGLLSTIHCIAAGCFTVLPSTLIASLAGSTICPSCAGAPFTCTRPAATSSSARRRNATPALASARWIRIVTA